ncbi:MAG: hypothetical protein QOF95_2455 [Pseudonocardiales bacterium]|nr:hypothetical protein [Pseudonocardiales bacterium]
MTSDDAAKTLADLGARYFVAQHTADPLNATLLGVTGFDDQLGDPSRTGSARVVAEIGAIHDELLRLPDTTLDADGRVEHDVLQWLVEGTLADVEHSLWESNASAAGYVSPQSLIFQAIPTAPLPDEQAVTGWLTRLRGLPAYIDAIAARYQQAAADGRTPTRVGVRQALTQLEGHLARDLADDVLLSASLPEGSTTARDTAAAIVAEQVRPTLRRLARVLNDSLLPVARDDEHVGLSWVPGGDEGYRAAVRRHTTTDLSPEQIHEIGLGTVAGLREEWAEVGGRALGITDVPEILATLRHDPGLRFETSAEIVQAVSDALARAEAVRGQWFPPFDITDCVVEEIDPVEVDNAALAYYRPPSADGTRPGAHCVLTTDPTNRFAYEYEALAFHESVPGHHLQIASAQTLTWLPPHRRYIDAQLSAYVEGWGLYSERLADDMGLYSSDRARLGMLSFDALRACRLVVDTGMHALGWSRERAAQFMWDNTATTRANVTNEIDRYIAWPGQALSYMIGRREIVRLRDRARAVLGSRFEARDFHGVVLSQGAVPLPVLGGLVDAWTNLADGVGRVGFRGGRAD